MYTQGLGNTWFPHARLAFSSSLVSIPKFYTCQPFNSLRVLPLSHFLIHWDFPCISLCPPQICLCSAQRFSESPLPWLTFTPLFWALYHFIFVETEYIDMALDKIHDLESSLLEMLGTNPLFVHFAELALNYSKRYDLVCMLCTVLVPSWRTLI